MNNMSATKNTQHATSTSQSTIRPLAKAALLPLVIALAAVVAVFVAATEISGDLLVTSPGADGPEAITIGVALFSATAGTAAGVGIAWLARRFTPKPKTTFGVITLTGLSLYGAVPFLAAEAASTALWLNLMHTAVAVPVIAGLSKHLPSQRR